MGASGETWTPFLHWATGTGVNAIVVPANCGRKAMSEHDKAYFARRAAEEAELAQTAGDPEAEAAHRRLQRAYVERASVGDRPGIPAQPVA